MSALLVDDLSVRIGEVPVVSGVAFALHPGDRLGVIGESGSGKTLTALAVMGLLPEGGIAEGRVTLDGDSILGLGEAPLARLRGRRLAMVFQEPMTALDPVMTVGGQLAGAIRRHQSIGRAASRRLAIELLAQVELPDPGEALRAYPHQLSGGQRQRVVLAMALANEPDVLICDEPTTALDVTVQAKVLRLVDRLVRDRNAALLFITHDLAVVSEVCDSVLVMYGGRVVEHGPVADVFAAPRHPYTAGLLAASDLRRSRAGTRLRTIPGSVPGAGRFPAGCPFRGRCPRELPVCVEMPALVPDADSRRLACHNPMPS